LSLQFRSYNWYTVLVGGCGNVAYRLSQSFNLRVSYLSVWLLQYICELLSQIDDVIYLIFHLLGVSNCCAHKISEEIETFGSAQHHGSCEGLWNAGVFVCQSDIHKRYSALKLRLSVLWSQRTHIYVL